jgi:protein phosphatase
MESKPVNERDTAELRTVVTSSTAPSYDPASALVQVDLGGLSHQGKVRLNNEDHYLVVRINRSLETLLTNLAAGALPPRFEETAYGMLVADGMGGMAAGEVASRLALLTLVELVVNTPDWIMKMDQRENAEKFIQRLTERFRRVDAALKEEARSDPKLIGMGTTLTLAASWGADLFLGHIGDSRAYLLRGGRLYQLTRDDTLAQALIDAGVAQPKDRTTNAMRHVLTAALGSTGEPSDPEVNRLRLADGDQVMLCTDGLTEMVDEETIGSTLRDAKSADEACRSLIDLALKAGGKDNATVVIARYRFP